MKATKWPALVLLALVGVVLGWSVTRVLESGGSVMPLPVTALVAMLVIATAVLVVGIPVRRWNRGDRSRRLDPLRAARTAVLAKASSHSGALLIGWYLGQGLTLIPDLHIEPRRSRLIVAVLAMLAALTMVVAGLITERWCRLPDGDDDPDAGAGSERREAPPHR
ncbi:MAG TPA: DUF3180 domain-containing protein [Actinomycetales bacterium]|nr:DUF3180 domain-containing protein [Actinomycetales bacterium]